MEDKISVIVPIYNAEKWLKRCLESIVNQTYTNLEILLINDGSTDNSFNICKDFEERDKRIILINKSNEGVSKTRNVGLEKATGKYIKFVDSDDWMEKETCEELIKLIQQEKTDLAICGLNIYKNNNILRTPHLKKKIVEIKKDIKEFEYIYKVFASPCNKLYKKDKIKQQFKTDLDMGEDLLFNLMYLKQINIISITEQCLYNVCLDNEKSLNRKFREDKLDTTLKLTEQELNFCKKTYGNLENATFLYNKYLLLLHAYLLQISTHLDKTIVKNKIRKYVNDKDIENACNYAKMERIDYKVFKELVKSKMYKLIYYYIKLKTMLSM